MADKLPSLNVLSGPLSGHKFVIEDAVDNILIGSDSSCGFVLDTPGVSPIHARLWVDLNGATVYDTNSPTGVYVNDDRVVKEAPVRNGDILWLGPPGADGSVLIQCILPISDTAGAAKAEGADSEVDTGAATLGFAVPTVDEHEPTSPSEASSLEEAAIAGYEDSDADSTVVLSSSAPMGSPIEKQTPPPEPDDTDATMLLDASDSVHVADEPTVAMPPPVPARPQPPPEPPPVPPAAEPMDDVGGFPDFDVEPTVVMPPPLPPKPTPAPPAPVPEFEDELEPTMVDAPRPGGTLPPPVPDRDLSEDDSTATVMFRPGEAPPPVPPPPAAPPAPPTPPRAVTPKPVEAPPAPPARPAAPPPKPAATPAARPPAEAKPAPRAAAPAPAPAVSARPAAAPVRARVEPRAATAPPAAAAPAPAPRGGGSSKAPLIAAAAVVVAALAFAAYWFTRSTPPEVVVATPSPAAPPETQPAPPTTQAAAPPVITEEPPVTVAAAPPETVAPVATTTPPPVTARSPLPSPSPRVAAATPKPGTVPPGQRPPVATPPPVSAAQQTAATVANLMGQARTAADAKNYDAAVSMYDEVLKLDPQNGPATAGRTAAVNARNASRKTFVSSRTVVQTEQKSKGPAGFDTSDVSVKSQDFVGRLEFAMNPATVKPGEPYKLQVALVNEGKKAIKISGMTFTVTVNGQKSGNPIAPKVKEVATGQRVVLEELPGVFPEAVTTWTAEVLVTANKGDSLRNQITWK